METNRLVFTLLVLLSAAVLRLAAREAQGPRINTPSTNASSSAVAETTNTTHSGTNVISSSESANEHAAILTAQAEKGDALAQFNLGLRYMVGAGVAEDSAEAVKWWRRAAEQNHTQAQIYLGNSYLLGDGAAKDEVQAVKWYRKAAEQGDVEAQRRMGEAYMQGQGVASDPLEAIRWWRKAAEQGDRKAQSDLGFVLLQGEKRMGNITVYRGIKKDPVESDKWLRKAAESYRVLAEQGDLAAQEWLASAYELSEGMKDLQESDKWYRKVAEAHRKRAEQGDARAQYLFGQCYLIGKGVPKDNSEAIRWLRRAASQGESSAQFSLGLHYSDGKRGVPKDFVQAYMWLNLSAANHENGESIAAFKREEVAAEMSPAQIEEAQRLARAFKPRKEGATGHNSSPENPTASGTGFLISEDGFLVTNEHVVRDAAQVRLVTSAGLISAKVVKVDAANDLALLKAEGRFAALPVAVSRGVKLGGTVATVGFPNIGLQGFAPKLAKGEIASLSGAGDDARYFQISVPVQPGNSGGALVDERGNVVGVVSAKLSARAALAATGALPENVNYAVKSSYLLSFLESVPEVSAKLKEANTKEMKFEDVVKAAEQAAVLVLVY